MSQIQIDEVNSTTTYVGISKPGALTSSQSWKIYKLTYSSGKLTTVEMPTEANARRFQAIWDNRTTYTYG